MTKVWARILATSSLLLFVLVFVQVPLAMGITVIVNTVFAAITLYQSFREADEARNLSPSPIKLS